MKRLYTVLVLFLVFSFSIISNAKDDEYLNSPGSVYNLYNYDVEYTVGISYTLDKETTGMCAYVYNIDESIPDASSLDESITKDIIENLERSDLVSITEFKDSNSTQVSLKEGTYAIVLKNMKSDIAAYKNYYKIVDVKDNTEVDLALTIDRNEFTKNFTEKYSLLIVIGIIGILFIIALVASNR